MRLRNVKGAEEGIRSSAFVPEEPEKNRGLWREVFPEKHPIHLEIGCGKGRFLMDMATLHKEIDYLGIELHKSVLIRAVQKVEENPVRNLLFLNENAEYLEDFFAPGEIEKIYLNFSDPWPKDRHKKRRLTSGAFLERYDRLLPPSGEIEFKTDNTDLFAFSLEEAEASVFSIEETSYDLHSDTRLMETNVMTEYEEKFSSRGNKICYMKLKKPGHPSDRHL